MKKKHEKNNEEYTAGQKFGRLFVYLFMFNVSNAHQYCI